MKRALKLFLYLLALLMVISFAMKFDVVAQGVSNTIGQPIETVKNIANVVFFVALGAFLIWAGVATMAIPVVGVILILIGLALLGTALYSHFNTKTLGE
jgi:hypothetical protein